jgi:UDP-N-acetylmuramate: L-alanyl-gamma-D-glutamyl-meso-diaminopimelate ligase
MKVHLSGACGTAMASLAGLLRERGDEVTGSDQDVYPPMSDQLAALGIPLRSPYHERNVPEEADLVVIGNALSRGNPEVEVVLDRRQPMTSLPALLGEELIRGHQSLVVAGTHGKTTTTSMLALILDRAGLEPSFLVGGVPADFARSYRLGRGRHFVVEGDEYDCAFFDKRPKFVHYLPDVAVIGNVEFDHADIYPDLEAVKTAFLRLLSVVPRRGRIVAGIDSPTVQELLPRAYCPVETFAIDAEADWRADQLQHTRRGCTFRLCRREKPPLEVSLPLHGEHNVRNALAAIAAAAAAGVEPERAASALSTFKGVRRRLERLGEPGGVLVLEDFAHPPTAVRETLRALRRLVPAGGRLFAAFEPRSFTSRTRIFQDDFARALSLADVVVVAAAHLPGKVPEERRLSEEALVGGIRALGKDARFVPGVAEIVGRLTEELRAGDTVVLLSNGGFGGIQGRLLAALAEHPSRA